MGNVLLLDTSAEGLTMALSLEGGRLLRLRRSGARRQDQALWPALEALLKRAKLELKDLDGVAAVRGPGRFTGVRIGLAFALVLGRSLGKPAAGLSALEALALQAAPKVPEGSTVLALLNAAREEVFSQLFRVREPGPAGAAPAAGGLGALISAESVPRWCALKELPAGGPAPDLLAGEPAAAAAALWPNARVADDRGPGPEALAKLARLRLSELSATGGDPGLAPLYLKPAKYELLGL